jgi:hypothetical protein
MHTRTPHTHTHHERTPFTQQTHVHVVLDELGQRLQLVLQRPRHGVLAGLDLLVQVLWGWGWGVAGGGGGEGEGGQKTVMGRDAYMRTHIRTRAQAYMHAHSSTHSHTHTKTCTHTLERAGPRRCPPTQSTPPPTPPRLDLEGLVQRLHQVLAVAVWGSAVEWGLVGRRLAVGWH